MPDPLTLGETIFQLANGQGKGRSFQGERMREMKTWRVLFFSTGNVNLKQHLASAKKVANDGMETRILDIPARPSGAVHCFENLQGMADVKDFSGLLIEACKQQHGTLVPALLETFLQNPSQHLDWIKRHKEKTLKAFAPNEQAGDFLRCAGRFALVAAVGEWATLQGLTGWQAGAARWGVEVCFNDWLVVWGGRGARSPRTMIGHVRRWLTTHASARMPVMKRDGGEEVVSDWATQSLAGWRRPEVLPDVDVLNRVEPRYVYLIQKDVFITEVCAGMNADAVAEALDQAGYVKTDKASRRSYYQRVRIPNVARLACLVVLPEVFEDPDEQQPEPTEVTPREAIPA